VSFRLTSPLLSFSFFSISDVDKSSAIQKSHLTVDSFHDKKPEVPIIELALKTILKPDFEKFIKLTEKWFLKFLSNFVLYEVN
jgi:hypothetical protein